MKLILCVVFWFVWAAPVAADLTRDQLPPEISSQISDAQLELTNWMMFYYKNPRPDEFPGWLRKVSAEGMLKGDDRQYPFFGFAATLFAAQEENVPAWMETIDSLPEDERKIVFFRPVAVRDKDLKIRSRVRAEATIDPREKLFQF